MTISAKPSDDFEATRIVYETLKPFPKEDQLRVLRWVQEKLGIAEAVATAPPPAAPLHPSTAQSPQVPPHAHGHSTTDIRTFIEGKNPKSDNQFAAAVAYFHRFEAPEGHRKEDITKEDLVTACRQVNRKRPKTPAQVLVNAHHQGLLDRSEEAGHYRINAVGENLVAMVLPSQDGATKRKANSAAKRAARKPKRPGK